MLDWTPPARLTATRLEGRHVVLEPLAREHAPDLFAAIAGPSVDWSWLPVEAPADVTAMRDLVDGWLAEADMETYVVRPAGGDVAGRISWIRQDPANGCAEVAWVVFGPGLRGTPASAATVHLLLHHAFASGYRRIEWKCDDANERSKRAAVRLGFSPEGLFRQHRVVKGLNRDTAWFAMTDGDWARLQEAEDR